MSRFIFNNGLNSPECASSKANRHVKDPETTEHSPEAPRLPLGNTKPAPLIASPQSSTTFTRISRCLSRAVKKLRSMGCMGVEHNHRHARECISCSPELAFNSVEKVPQASNCSDGISYRSSITLTDTSVALTKMISSDSRGFRQRPLTSTSIPSTNNAYKECRLFSPGSLQLAAALLGTMEPLIFRSVPRSIDDWEPNVQSMPPGRRWIHRKTTIRPGYCVQIPAVHDKGYSYTLFPESDEPKWPSGKDVLKPLGEDLCPKLFVAPRAAESRDVARTDARAFIMCNPVEQVPDPPC